MDEGHADTSVLAWLRVLLGTSMYPLVPVRAHSVPTGSPPFVSVPPTEPRASISIDPALPATAIALRPLRTRHDPVMSRELAEQLAHNRHYAHLVLNVCDVALA
jgi:hypothetical protein